jgi:hypothetical protein
VGLEAPDVNRRGTRKERGPNWERNRAKRQRDIARAEVRFAALIQTLGGKCATCGEERPELLTLDHVDGITWNRYALRLDARIGKYIRELAEGVRLQVLCGVCNSRDGQARQQPDYEPCPF